MKPTANPDRPAPILAFGAHPDDIEFGAGAVVALEARRGRRSHFVVCSRGESASRGTPARRSAEARRSAALLGARLQFVLLDGDGRLEVRPEHALKLAAVIRRIRPAVILAPSLAENQHPDHPRLGRLVREAARLARYGGVAALRSRPAHAVGSLLFYAVAPEAEPRDVAPVLIDVSQAEVMAAWTAAMNCHATQMKTRPYAELQLARARVHGLRAGVPHAQALYPSDPLVFDSLDPLVRSARQF